MDFENHGRVTGDRPFRVGSWLVQPTLNRISNPDKTVRVEPKMMEVLVRLADQPGEAVSREALLETVWVGTVVNDDVLTRSISELRKAFDDDPRNPHIIETIPKTGYRLIAPVTFDYRGNSAAEAEPELALAPSAPLPPPEASPGGRSLFWSVLMVTSVIAVVGLFWYQRSLTSSISTTWQSVPLTTYLGQESRPVFAPDGNRVAFAWSGADGQNWDIYVKLVGSETPLRLTTEPVFESNPAWSPDASKIAFIRRDETGCALYIVAALGGPARRLDACHANIYGDLAWSPDGAWLAFNDRTSENEAFRIVLLSPTTLERRILTMPPPDTWGDHDPAFSPDGTQLTFTRSVSEGMQDLYTVPVTGGEATRLTFDSRNIYGSTWTTDGKAILFASNRSGPRGLWRISARGDTPAWVPVGYGQIAFPDIARDQPRLTYMRADGQTNIWLVETGQDPLTPTPLVTSTHWDLHPQPSPDGSKLAFTSNRSGYFEIWLSDIDGTQAIQLTSFEGPFTSAPRWSPDGRRLVFDARPDGHADLYLMDAAGGLPQRLTDEASDELGAQWSHDGRWIYFGSDRSGTWEVWKMPADGGEAVQVTTGGGFGPAEAPDGQFLYYTKHNQPGLWCMPTTGGPESVLIPTLDARDWGSWAVLDAGIYFVQRGNPTTLSFFDFASGQTTALFTPARPIPIMDPALAVSKDGRWLFFGQTERADSDLMLVEDFR